MSESETPSERARELVRGGYDMHVHIDPDFVPRIIDDIGLARRCLELGLAGFQMKSHYTSTAERARTVNAAVPGVHAIGAIVLNRAVGGMNALAVEIAAREGARTVWLPTVNSLNEMAEIHSFAPGASMPVWMKFEVSLREAGIEAEPVVVVYPDGKLTMDAQKVIEVVARHHLVLATGHLARDEIFAVVAAALDAGIRDVVVTHPEFPSQNLSIEDQVVLASGARCWSAASRRRTPARCRTSTYSTASVRRGWPTTCCPPTLDRCSTRRWRTVWRCLPIASSTPVSARRMSGR